MTLKDKSWMVFAVILVIAFYFSGMFVFLTPLPILYHLLVRKKEALWRVALPGLLIVGALYLFLFAPLTGYYQRHPEWSWLFPFPGMDLVGRFPLSFISFYGISLYLFFIGVALAIYQAIRTTRLSFFVGTGTCLAFLVLVCIVLVYSFKGPTSPFFLLENYYSHALEESFQTNVFLSANLSLVTFYLARLTPSLALISILFIMLLNLVILQRVFYPVFPDLQKLKLNEWTFPFGWVWGVIAALVLLLVNSYLWKEEVLLFGASNVLIVFFAVYFVRGLAISGFFMEAKQWGVFFRIGFYTFIVIFFHTLGVLVAGLGFFDSWFDFRGRMRGLKRG